MRVEWTTPDEPTIGKSHQHRGIETTMPRKKLPRNPAIIYAFEKTGLLVTEANEHLKLSRGA